MPQPTRGRLLYIISKVPLPQNTDIESRLRLAGHLLASWTGMDLDDCYWTLADFCHGCFDRAGRSDPDFSRLVRKALETAELDASSGEPFCHESTRRWPACPWSLPWEWIALRAYYLWEQRGRPWGQAERNWLDAEQDLALLYPALNNQRWVEAA